MATLLINPNYAEQLREQGLRQIDDYLRGMHGVAVGRHADRLALRVPLGSMTGYLKRESRVPLRERLRNWWAGFGFCSKSEREWLTLQRLRELGLACPEPLAMGTQAGQAFLLVRGLGDAVDLPTWLAFAPTWDARRALLVTLGRAIADLHAAGFTHPDLYAKHVFVQRTTGQVVFIDFQRTAWRRRVSWRERYRDLAALDATLHWATVSLHERMRLLRAYLKASGVTAWRREVRRAAVAISRRRHWLLRRRRIQCMHDETAVLAGAARTISYCRVTVPEHLRAPLPPPIPERVAQRSRA